MLDVDEITLSGGYNTCSDATSNIVSNTKTIINGGDSALVISIREGTDVPSFLTLQNLRITNGKNSGVYQSGGISIYTPNHYTVNVNVRDSQIDSNTGVRGGGVSLNGHNTRLFLDASLIINNQAIGTAGSAGSGGGLYCSKGLVHMQINSGISNNQAISSSESGGHGGGIYATQACNVRIESGTLGGFFDFRGISSNSATGHGGGIYASSNADLTLDTGIYNLPVNLDRNATNMNDSNSGDGGGIYLTGNGTSLQAVGILLDSNFALHGGGAAVNNGALLVMSASGTRCWDRKKCNQVTENEATASTGFSKGGAFFVENAFLEISDAHIHHNQADRGVVLLAAESAQVKLERSFVYRNGDFSNPESSWDSIFAYGLLNSNLIMLHVTSTYNDADSATIRQVDGDHLIYGSIIYEPITNQTGSLINTTGIKNCLLLQNNYGIQNLTNSLLEDPLFADINTDDFHLTADSGAIDRCTPDGIETNTHDVDGETAPFDVFDVADWFGIYDIGADEYHDAAQIEDQIFANGFD